MQEYVRLESGHMEFLIRALDGDPGSVRPPALPPLPAEVASGMVQETVTFLRRTSLPIEPRKQWPAGGMPRYGIGRRLIPTEHRAEAGKALCIWGNAGWGGLVRRGKYRDGRFADELVRACADLMAQWTPRPAPEWVTCIPSREPLPGGPALLVDDMVDSRWTLTVAAWLLRSNGSGEVWPLALALAGQGR